MPVIRVEKNKDYTVMSNHHLRDKRLSLKTVGLLSIILSLPDEWDYTVKGLVAIVKDGSDAVKAALRELEEYGYLTRERARNEKGQVKKAVYSIREKPVAENPIQANPIQEKSTEEKPVEENRTQLNTKVTKYGENTNKEKVSKEGVSKESTRARAHVRGGKAALAPFSTIPDGELKEALLGYAEMRKQIKVPLTQRAEKLALSTLDKLAPGDLHKQAQIVDQSTLKGWRGLFPLKDERGTGETENQRKTREAVEILGRMGGADDDEDAGGSDHFGWLS